MNNNEIIKAFASLYKKLLDVRYDLKITAKEFKALNSVNTLVNRQQAEIERYKGVIKRLENDVKEAQAELKEFKALYVNKVAEMGIKAFAERLKKCRVIQTANMSEYIDNLVKEMTEQSVNYGSSKTEK